MPEATKKGDSTGGQLPVEDLVPGEIDVDRAEDHTAEQGGDVQNRAKTAEAQQKGDGEDQAVVGTASGGEELAEQHRKARPQGDHQEVAGDGLQEAPGAEAPPGGDHGR